MTALSTVFLGLSKEALPALLYHGKPMEPEPINLRLSEIYPRLATGQPIHAVLEPGDATRYELVIMWLLHYGYFVARIERGDDTPRGVYLAEHYDIEELLPLGSNPWTIQVFDWWIRIALGMPPRPSVEDA